MKNALKTTCLALLVLALAGCGKNPQVPQNTIAAAYVDLEKAYENGTRFTRAIIGELPDASRPDALKAYDRVIKDIGRYKDALNPKWAVITFGGAIANPPRALRRNVAMAVRIDTDESTADKTLRQWIKERTGKEDVKPDVREKGVVYEVYSFHAGRIGGDILVFSDAKEAFEDMFSLYTGKSAPSNDFRELFRISGNTLARISTIPIYSVIDRFGLTAAVEKFGVACDDEDLADMILHLGVATLDILADEQDIGLSLRIVCGSSDDAKMFEHVFQTIAFVSRTGSDLGAYFAANPANLPALFESYKDVIGRTKIFFNAASRAFDAARNGRIAEITFAMSIDMIAKALAKAFDTPHHL